MHFLVIFESCKLQLDWLAEVYNHKNLILVSSHFFPGSILIHISRENLMNWLPAQYSSWFSTFPFPFADEKRQFHSFSDSWWSFGETQEIMAKVERWRQRKCKNINCQRLQVQKQHCKTVHLNISFYLCVVLSQHVIGSYSPTEDLGVLFFFESCLCWTLQCILVLTLTLLSVADSWHKWWMKDVVSHGVLL